MTAVAVPAMSDRGRAILRTFRATFAALGEHQKLEPSEVLEIAAFVMSHVRSAWPQALTTMPALDTGPVARVEPPINEIERTVHTDGKYRLTFDDGHIVMVVTDEADTAVIVLAPEMAETLRADIARMGAR